MNTPVTNPNIFYNPNCGCQPQVGNVCNLCANNYKVNTSNWGGYWWYGFIVCMVIIGVIIALVFFGIVGIVTYYFSSSTTPMVESLNAPVISYNHPGVYSNQALGIASSSQFYENPTISSFNVPTYPVQGFAAATSQQPIYEQPAVSGLSTPIYSQRVERQSVQQNDDDDRDFIVNISPEFIDTRGRNNRNVLKKRRVY